jgi:hypothetical protein
LWHAAQALITFRHLFRCLPPLSLKTHLISVNANYKHHRRCCFHRQQQQQGVLAGENDDPVAAAAAAAEDNSTVVASTVPPVPQLDSHELRRQQRLELALKVEVEEQIVFAQNWADELLQRFPEVSRAIKTKMAARMLLATERHHIHRLAHEGVMTGCVVDWLGMVIVW